MYKFVIRLLVILFQSGERGRYVFGSSARRLTGLAFWLVLSQI